ncbi:UDP-glucose dehydrogenase family protein [Rhodobium gokarnense]|uniref:UDP-glucose 6-dehydrogenase n=1 Tax=Rhodobium gokarnense TaxID=364296 RepID=A0ABT3HFT9_9HYPH|nr:UDP-glucose/GDP-mannose dehydrogenase family protein [Rhodobium gokarnense]MCW2309262.1 UDPglucose 6-dehydrogenase [Rhodobium gokarnense]
MKITMIGTGYVGLVSGACFSEFGFDVTCVDVDEAKIARLEKGEIPIYEPGLDDLVARGVAAGRLDFTTNLEDSVQKADVVFIAVGTPSRRGDGEADLRYVHAAARQIANAMRPGTVIAIKSTVVVGTCREVQRIVAEERPGVDFSIASNPEFLREGSAVEDFMRPDRVICGVADERGEETMRRLYRPLNLRETPMVITTLENAELAKYAANAFLAMKVTFINEVANLCEAVGGDVQVIASAIGLDKRIGNKFLHAGPGFGGSCFPKDTRAYAATGRKYGRPQKLIETTIDVNESRKVDMAERILAALGPDPAGKTVAVLGIAFKPNTDDVREAPSLVIVQTLEGAGVTVRAHDPEAMGPAKELLPNVTWCDAPYETAEGADALVMLTEWNAFRALDLKRMRGLMRGDALVDLRNVYPPEDARDAGLRYFPLGKAAPAA